jgi:hypothetical protein
MHNRKAKNSRKDLQLYLKLQHASESGIGYMFESSSAL